MTKVNEHHSGDCRPVAHILARVGDKWTILHIGMAELLGIMREGKTMADYPYLIDTAKTMLDELVWWTKALKVAREQ